MDAEYLRAYQSFEEMAQAIPEDGRQHIVLYQPDTYIKLLLENQKLEAEVTRLKAFEWKWQMEMKQNMNMISKIQWCADELERHGVKIPFRPDGSDR